jgi:hypothetical protein
MKSQTHGKVKLEALRSELTDALVRVNQALADLSNERTGDHLSPVQTESDANRKPIRTVRSVVLDALDDFRWPAYTRELVTYCSARYGREIASARFGTLASDETKAYSTASRPRAVWLAFALTYDRAEPIKRLWTRSDWPLEWRIMAPTTGRVQYLKATVRLCELAAEEAAANPEMMRIIAADHARDLPGVQFKRGVFDLRPWRDLALEHLTKLEPRDEEMRREAAAKWAPRLNGASLLFGAPEVIDGGAGLSQARGAGA